MLLIILKQIFSIELSLPISS